jgi:chromosome segregation ATPase
MAKNSGSKFNAAAANKQQSQIRDQVRAMEQEHERLMNGLDATQKQAWQEQIKNTNQLRQQVNLQLQQMDTELGSSNPDSKRVTERAREIEQTMNNWRKEYKTLSSQAGS